MRNWLIAFVVFCCLTACQRPVAYFQRTAHVPAARLSKSIEAIPTSAVEAVAEPVVSVENLPESADVLVASATQRLVGENAQQVRQHTQRISRFLTNSATTEAQVVGQQQPKPKPKPKMRLGNKIRDALGMPLRQELNWWQRISWKLKASVIIILVAVLFAIFHITILAIIFGIVAAFLLISGLRRSFKVRRPWF
ncbi:hypothetical protein [uncultured Spirosoma sp.]|uniref:hypothetical protein n=1 Tax=uncultured Spirosoma sp. TaxID=278208 RepID=UPI002585A673|nr:hypothetical protein [uncultured Spirosoma sp.]